MAKIQLEYLSPIENPMPTSARVIGIVGICLGGLTLVVRFSSLWNMVVIVMTTSPQGHPPIRDLAYPIGSSALYSALAGLLIAASIGCLQRKEFARRWLVRYAVVYAIALVPDGIAMALTSLKFHRAIRADAKSALLPLNYLFVYRIAWKVLVRAVVTMIFPTVILICMRKPVVLAAFQSEL